MSFAFCKFILILLNFHTFHYFLFAAYFSPVKALVDKNVIYTAFLDLHNFKEMNGIMYGKVIEDSQMFSHES